MDAFSQLLQTTGIYNLTLGEGVMMGVCLLLIWLAIVKEFEPLLLLPPPLLAAAFCSASSNALKAMSHLTVIPSATLACSGDPVTSATGG